MKSGTLMSDAEVRTAGLPVKTGDGQSFEAFVLETAEDLLDNLPRRSCRTRKPFDRSSNAACATPLRRSGTRSP